jgi:hypothetical protein
MKTAEFRVVSSTVYPGKVSLRTTGSQEGLRDVLTAAGFQHGDRVVVVEKATWERLCAAHVSAVDGR